MAKNDDIIKKINKVILEAKVVSDFESSSLSILKSIGVEKPEESFDTVLILPKMIEIFESCGYAIDKKKSNELVDALNKREKNSTEDRIVRLLKELNSYNRIRFYYKNFKEYLKEETFVNLVCDIATNVEMLDASDVVLKNSNKLILIKEAIKRSDNSKEVAMAGFKIFDINSSVVTKEIVQIINMVINKLIKLGDASRLYTYAVACNGRYGNVIDIKDKVLNGLLKLDKKYKYHNLVSYLKEINYSKFGPDAYWPVSFENVLLKSSSIDPAVFDSLHDSLLLRRNYENENTMHFKTFVNAFATKNKLMDIIDYYVEHYFNIYDSEKELFTQALKSRMENGYDLYKMFIDMIDGKYTKDNVRILEQILDTPSYINNACNDMASSLSSGHIKPKDVTPAYFIQRIGFKELKHEVDDYTTDLVKKYFLDEGQDIKAVEDLSKKGERQMEELRELFGEFESNCIKRTKVNRNGRK